MKQISNELDNVIKNHDRESRVSDLNFYDLEQKVAYGRQLINYVKMLEIDRRSLGAIEGVASCHISVRGVSGGSVILSSDHKPRCSEEYKELYRELMERLLDQQITEARTAFAALNLGPM